MTKRKRRNHSASFKAKAAMAAVRGDKTLAEPSQQYDVYPNQIQGWKKRLMSGAEELFENGSHKFDDSEQKMKELHAKIGELTMDREFLVRALGRDR